MGWRKVQEGCRRPWGLVRQNQGIVIWAVVMTLLSGGMLMMKLIERGISTHSGKAVAVLATLVVLTIIVGGVLCCAKLKHWRIEKVFLILGLLIGTLYVFISPMSAQVDESGHFLRAYELAEGNFLSEGEPYVVEETSKVMGTTYVPYNVWAAASRAEDGGAEDYARVFSRISVKAEGDYRYAQNYIDGYSIFNYLPQVSGILIGEKMLGLPIIPTMYFCRLLNMVCCVLALYLCIKYIPVMKKTVFLIGMFPMTMNLFASLSADGSIICAGIALITFVLYAREKMRRRLGWKDFLLLLFICLVLTVTKPIYAFLCLIVFWLPKERFKSNKQKMWFIVLLGGITLGCVLLQMGLEPMVVDEYGARAAQTATLMNSPWYVLWQTFRSLVDGAHEYISWTIGGFLEEWFQVELYPPYIIVLMVFFVLALFEQEGRMPKSLRIFAGSTLVVTTLVIFALEFLIWTKTDDEFIMGAQGRYFLPVLLLLPMATMPSRKPKHYQLIRPAYLYMVTALINVFVMLTILGTHI